MAKELWLEDSETGKAVIFQDDTDPDPDTEKWTKTIDPEDWDANFTFSKQSYKTFRNQMIIQFEPNWGTYTDDQKKALIRNWIWPSGTSASELNALYPASARNKFRQKIMRKLDEGRLFAVIKSKTVGSKKRWAIQVDDSGTITTIEITTDTKI